jgi:NAD(P)-dependent dehydrogenase (short-subunit alcohol dehydrogenase family)
MTEPTAVETRSLANKRVLVVGASRGIGMAIAVACAEAGAAVALAARSMHKLEAAAAPYGSRAIAVACDVCDETQATRAVETVVDRFGGLDALVYSTGMSIFRPVAAMPLTDWRQVFNTNVLGAACITGAAMPHLEAAKGHAIFLGSESALYEPTPWRGIGAYIASKRALDSIVRSFQLENPSVAFTNLVVGSTTTEFGSEDQEGVAKFAADWVARGYLYQTVLDPADHAEMIIKLLSMADRVLVDHVRVRVRPGAG